MQISRAPSVQLFRDHVLFRLGLRDVAPGPPEIGVALKTAGFQGGPAWKDLCTYVDTVVMKIEARYRLPVFCFDPVKHTFQETVRIVQKFEIFIAEHGTVSYNGIWCRDGTTLISIGNNQEMKEPHTLLYMTHVKTLYTSFNQKSDLDSVILFSLQKELLTV